MTLWFIVASIVFLLLLFVVIFNRLVGARNAALAAWSDIDAELKRRADLVLPLVETVRGYMAHEKELLDRVTTARVQALQSDDQAERQRTEGALTGALGRIFAVVENYPDLKATRNFQELEKALAATEDRIQASRREYNDAVRIFDTRVQSFPDNLIAAPFGFMPMPYFELENMADRTAPKPLF